MAGHVDLRPVVAGPMPPQTAQTARGLKQCPLLLCGFAAKWPKVMAAASTNLHRCQNEDGRPCFTCLIDESLFLHFSPSSRCIQLRIFFVFFMGSGSEFALLVFHPAKLAGRTCPHASPDCTHPPRDSGGGPDRVSWGAPKRPRKTLPDLVASCD